MLRSRGRRRTAYVGSTGHYRSPKSCRGSPRANGFAAPCGSRTRELTHHPPLSADDVLLDRQSLEGKEVRIQAYTACDGNVSPCFLFNDRTNFTKGLLFDGTGLPRLDRSRLMDCTLLAPCQVTIIGRISQDPLSMVTPLTIVWGLASPKPPQQEMQLDPARVRRRSPSKTSCLIGQL